MKISFIVRTIVAILAIATSMTACDVETFDDARSGIGSGPPPPPPPPGGFGPNFSEIQAFVFTPDCATSSCHDAISPAAGLNLTATNSYAELFGITSTQDITLQRVMPFQPDNSYLIRKLENAAGIVANIMPPPPDSALPAASITTIRQWIMDGAIDDRVAVLDPVQVQSLSPMPNEILAAQPPQIIAGFTRELNALSLNATTFILESSGGDGSFVDGSVVAIPAATPPALVVGNPLSAVFDLSGVVLADDVYRISLLGDIAGPVIMDLDGNALDGEDVGAFPSGDGTAGGDYQAFFTISTPVVVLPTLADIQLNVFTPSCAGCHNGVGAALPGVLNLSDAAASYLDLVGAGGMGVPSIQQAGVLRVAPGDADASYLIRKLEATVGITGGVMPPGAPLDPALILVIRQWINDGALQ